MDLNCVYLQRLDGQSNTVPKAIWSSKTPGSFLVTHHLWSSNQRRLLVQKRCRGRSGVSIAAETFTLRELARTHCVTTPFLLRLSTFCSRLPPLKHGKRSGPATDDVDENHVCTATVPEHSPQLEAHTNHNGDYPAGSIEHSGDEHTAEKRGHHDHEHNHAHHHEHDDKHHDHDDHDHHHHHSQERAPGPLHKGLKTVFQFLGIAQLANALDDNLAVTVAMVTCFILGAALPKVAGVLGMSAVLAAKLTAVATAGVYVLGGIPEAVGLCYNLADGHIDTHVLMSLAVFGTLWMGAAVEGALLLVLFRVSHAVEHQLTHVASGQLSALVQRLPQHATLVQLDQSGEPLMSSAQLQPASQVALSSLVLVRPGEQVPLDGEVVHGRALVSSQMITGESLPVLKKVGSVVPAGALNHDGVLVVRSSRRVQDSTPARIAALTATAQANKPQIRRWLDSFGEVYSRGVVLAALAAAAGLLATGVPLLGSASQRGALYRAMGLLTVASPCALVMVPLAYVSALAAVNARGMLVKGSRVLDSLAACNVVALDKTGTLTTGTLAATTMITPPQHSHPTYPPHTHAQSIRFDEAQEGEGAGGCSAWAPEDVSALAAAVALSQRSSHPVSRAVAALGAQAGPGLALPALEDFKQVPGGGVQALVKGKEQQRLVLFGSRDFVAPTLGQRQLQQLDDTIGQWGSGGVVSVLALHPTEGGVEEGDTTEPVLLRVFTFEDTIRRRSAAAVKLLRTGKLWGKLPGEPIHVVMLTGDHLESAGRVAGQLGIEELKAGLSPEDKLEEVQRLLRGSGAGKAGGGVVMVGDGINDAPALAAATVGMAFVSTPDDAAAAAADVLALGTDPISSIPYLLAVAYRTQAVVRQNLVLAFGSVAVLTLPTVLGFIPLWLAVLLHEGSTLLVALNSLRLLATPPHPLLTAHEGADAAELAPTAHMKGQAHSEDDAAVRGQSQVVADAA